MAKAAQKIKSQSVKTHEQKTLPMVVFAHLYFVLQYFAIRCFLFGFEMRIMPEDIIRALKVQEIIILCSDLVSSFSEIITAEYILLIFINLLPFAIRFAILITPAVLFMYSCFSLMLYCIAQMDILSHGKHHNEVPRPDGKVSSCSFMLFEGQPGNGKTSTCGFFAVWQATINWMRLRWKRYLMRGHVAEWKRCGNAEKLAEWKEVNDSYEFWMTHDCIPCLMSNIPIMVGGQFVLELLYEHAEQSKKIPYMTCLMFDEWATYFPNSMSVHKILTISDFYRLHRHAGEFMIFGTEQQQGSGFIDGKRVLGVSKYMLSQTWVNIPWALLIPYRLLRALILAFDDGGYNKPIAAFMKKYESLLNHIGQRRYTYYDNGNSTMDTPNPEVDRQRPRGRVRKKTMFLPCWLNYQYDNRTFRNMYLAKDLPIDVSIYTSLTIADTPENQKKFLKGRMAVEEDKQQKQIAKEVKKSDKKAA